MKSRISFLASAFAGFPASTADFHAKGWREKRWNSGGCDGLKKSTFLLKKVYYPPLIINLLRIFAAERVCRKRFLSWNMPKQPARP